ncbi:hypothetical protein [Delftia acidovorans]|uniref:hypothetical protein n=1 Tax=Delftia acidovorans TaxID=80866 RepID=UPI00192BE186|nr:hypothetical protein [Delftia acidovorans]
MMQRRTTWSSRSMARRAPPSHHQDRDERLALRAARAIESARATAGIRCSTSVSTGSTSGQFILKDKPLRSEPYRRLVAALPCAWCGVVGFSQHAHENTGKGARQKVDDRRAMPLCCARLKVGGCHAAFDQYRLVPGGRQAHIELGRQLPERTRAQIKDSGRWPAKLPYWQKGGSDAS